MSLKISKKVAGTILHIDAVLCFREFARSSVSSKVMQKLKNGQFD